MSAKTTLSVTSAIAPMTLVRETRAVMLDALAHPHHNRAPRARLRLGTSF